MPHLRFAMTNRSFLYRDDTIGSSTSLQFSSSSSAARHRYAWCHPPRHVRHGCPRVEKLFPEGNSASAIGRQEMAFQICPGQLQCTQAGLSWQVCCGVHLGVQLAKRRVDWGHHGSRVSETVPELHLRTSIPDKLERHILLQGASTFAPTSLNISVFPEFASYSLCTVVVFFFAQGAP